MRTEKVLTRIDQAKDITPALRQVTLDLASAALTGTVAELDQFCEKLARLCNNGVTDKAIGYREALFDLMAAISAEKVWPVKLQEYEEGDHAG